MKHLLILLATLVVFSIAAFAVEPNETYVATIGTRYEMNENGLKPVPIQCNLSLSDTWATVSFSDHAGLHVYNAKKVERVSETEYVFRGFSAYLPDGARGRFIGAMIMDDGAIVVLFACSAEPYPRSLVFKKK